MQPKVGDRVRTDDGKPAGSWNYGYTGTILEIRGGSVDEYDWEAKVRLDHEMGDYWYAAESIRPMYI